jgi:hypothetical protein
MLSLSLSPAAQTLVFKASTTNLSTGLLEVTTDPSWDHQDIVFQLAAENENSGVLDLVKVCQSERNGEHIVYIHVRIPVGI